VKKFKKKSFSHILFQAALKAHSAKIPLKGAAAAAASAAAQAR